MSKIELNKSNVTVRRMKEPNGKHEGQTQTLYLHSVVIANYPVLSLKIIIIIRDNIKR